MSSLSTAGRHQFTSPLTSIALQGVAGQDFSGAFTYVTEANEEPYVTALRDTLAWKYSLGSELKVMRSARQLARMLRDFTYFEAQRRGGARTIMKDPLAVCSANWLAERFGMKVVVIVRHPAAFTASLRAAGWGRVHFNIFHNQPALVRDRLGPYTARISEATV